MVQSKPQCLETVRTQTSINNLDPCTLPISVVRTLLGFYQNIITDPEDQTEEEDTIRQALRICGYPE